MVEKEVVQQAVQDQLYKARELLKLEQAKWKLERETLNLVSLVRVWAGEGNIELSVPLIEGTCL